MRCRVSQNWAGQGWGGMVIPRIGMEVVVEFLEGDPDKPLVTGCVYNGKNKVPYELPKHKTRSTFKTDTHKGSGFNELRFEDEKGEEEIFVHAQKDMNYGVLNNWKSFIGGFYHKHVKRNITLLVQGHKAEHAQKSSAFTSGGTIAISAGADSPVRTIDEKFFENGGPSNYDHEKLFWERHETETCTDGSLNLSSSGDTSISSDGEITLQTDKSFSLSSDDTISSVSRQHIRNTAKGNIYNSAGFHYVVASEGAIVMECGASKITMSREGRIEISGIDIRINGSNKICLN